MLLQLENTNTEKIKMLLDFAEKNQLNLKLIDEGGNDYFLPGKPLEEDELLNLVAKSRGSGNISLNEAPLSIKSAFNGD